MQDHSRRILLVDDDPDDFVLTRALLQEGERQPFDLEWASTLEAGRKALESERFDAVLIDYDLGPRTGVELVRQSVAGGYTGPMILLTGHGSYDIDLQAMQAGAVDFLNKNEVTPALLERTIRYAVERKQAENLLGERNLELEKARAELEERVLERTRELRQANKALEEANKRLEETNLKLAARSSELMAANLELEHANAELKQEIQERRRVEDDLREHTARLDLILNEIPAMLWSVDRDLNLTLMEGQAVSVLGIDPEELTGRSLQDLLSRRPDLLDCIRQVMAGEQVMTVAPSLFDAEQIMETHFAPFLAEGGEISGVIGVSILVTERKQAEELLKSRNEELARATDELSAANQQLKESQALFEGLFNSAPDPTLLTDRDGNILRANRRALENFGYSQDELSGRTVESLLLEELRATYLSLRDTYFRNPQVQPIQLDLELSGLRKDGSQFPIDFTLSPLRRAGEMQVICVIRDVTRRKLAEGALRESEARFRTVFEGSALGIALKDLDGRILATNPALTEMIGYTAAEMRNRRFDELTDPVDVPEENKLFEQLSSGVIDRYELYKRYLHKDGSRLWARVVVSVIKDESGCPQFAIFMVENIQDRKRIEAELAEVRRRLMDSREEERMELARDLHDGPMQELYGVVFQLGELQTELAQVELPVLSQAAGDENGMPEEALPVQLDGLRAHVLGTIQELRDFCGALRPPTLTPFGLEATLRAHAESFQEEHPEIDLKLDLQPDNLALPERVRVALFRIYQHSLANILRHASATQVEVSFAFDETQVSLEIQDNGKGFDVPRSWIDFVRQGHLGLAGAVERAEAIGGRLVVQSAPGKGTRLLVTAPRDESRPVLP